MKKNYIFFVVLIMTTYNQSIFCATAKLFTKGLKSLKQTEESNCITSNGKNVTISMKDFLTLKHASRQLQQTSKYAELCYTALIATLNHAKLFEQENENLKKDLKATKDLVAKISIQSGISKKSNVINVKLSSKKRKHEDTVSE